MYTALPAPAAEALRLGLVDPVSTNHDPLEDALDLALRIAGNGPRAIRSVKRCVDDGRNLHLADGLLLERNRWVDLIPDGDPQEGAAAFFDRGPPAYPNWPAG